MPRAVSVAIRQVIVERHERGETLQAVADDMELSLWTVRSIWRRYREQGEAGLKPDYENCGRKGVRSARLVYRGTIWLKRAHPKWGAGLIRLLVAEKWPELKVPHERTLQRWFRAEGINQRRKRRITGQNRNRGQEPHEVWQLDAKEQMKLADESEASWLMVTDEKTGGALAAVIFPPGDVDTGGSNSGTG